MRLTHIIILSIICLGHGFSAIQAQDKPLQLCGKDVHLSTSGFVYEGNLHTVSSAVHFTGNVIAINLDTLRLAAEGWSKLLIIPTSSILVMEVSQNRQNALSPGAGFLVGATIGFAIGMAVDKPGNDIAPIQTGALGALIGGITGMSLTAKFSGPSRESWEPIPIEQIGQCGSIGK